MTINQRLIETINTSIDQANDNINKLEEHNDRMTKQIERNQHQLDWNRGIKDHAKFVLEMIERGQDDDDIRTRLAAALHDHTIHWMKIAAKYHNVDRSFLDKPFDELEDVDKLAALQDADKILDALRGE